MGRPCLSSWYVAGRRSYYNEQWMAFVGDEDLVNHGRTTSKNGHASRCRPCCASQTTEVDEAVTATDAYVGVPPTTPGVAGIS